VARAALKVLVDENLAERALELGEWFMGELRAMESPHVADVRGRGLMIGVVIKDESGTARPFCEGLMKRGILAKETHEQVVRFAPPLVVEKADLEWALEPIGEVLGAVTKVG
jgi:ornithine--oxo-acid transaminase